jgi:dTDP-4-dehydrorhamnose reductase
VRILVTGREGQLVRSLIERARGNPDFEIVALGRPELDLERPETLAAPVRAVAPDLLINAAAYTAVDQAEDEPDRARIVNAEAPAALAAAARGCGARFIHISTDYVFDGRAGRPHREDDPVDPLGVYGRTKAEGEERVRADSPRHLIVRTAWVYSPFGRNFVRTMIGAAAAGRDTLRVVADQKGSPSSALDLADGLLAAARIWRARPDLAGTYHLAGTGTTSWCGFAEEIFRDCQSLGLPAARVEPITTSDWPTRAPRPAYTVLDCSRFERDFRYRMPAWQDSLSLVMRVLAGNVHAD